MMGCETMEAAQSPTLSHLGISVSDIERSLKFYCEGLGFKLLHASEAGNEVRKLMELDGEVRIETRFLRNGGTTVELLHFTSPKHFCASERAPINRVGLAQLTFMVDNIDEAAARLKALGGTVHEETRTALAFPGLKVDVLSCCDPDGVRVKIASSVAAD